MSVVDDTSIDPILKREIFCQVCNKSFKRGKDLKSHSVIHNDVKPFVCTQCPEAFKHKTSLKRHSLIHSGEKPFTCRVCGKSFRQKGSLNEHSLTHTGLKPHTCEVCNMGFTTKSNYGRHLRKHLISKPFICKICHKGFNVRAYLTRHYDKHKEIDDTVTSLKVEKEIDETVTSLEVESIPKTSFNEMELHTIEQPSSDAALSTDIVTVTDNILKRYLCKICNKEFSGFIHLKIHLQTHTDKKAYICDICNKCFTGIDAFCKHKITHNHENTSLKNFRNESEVLSETSISAGSVKKEYTESKTLDKRYICSVCNKTFLKEYHFMHHSFVHKYPGPYYCDICGENIEFKKLHELHKHYAEHGEVECICYNCNESGINDVDYSKSTVSKCVICYKCFPDVILLKKHFPIHKNRRPLLIKLNA